MRRWVAMLVLACASGSAFAQALVSPDSSRVFNPGRVLASVTQPDGKVIIGGDFRYVNGVFRGFLARINADGSLDTSWAPDIQGGIVRALALDADGSLFVGGDFSSAGPYARHRIAKISTVTGAVDGNWNPIVTGSPSTVKALAVDGAGNLYVGGAFTSFAGMATTNLAKVTTSAMGIPYGAWAPNPTGVVNALVLDGTDLYVGGDYTGIAGASDPHMAVLNTGNGTHRGRSHFQGLDGPVHAIAVSHATGRLYIGGAFTQVWGYPRRNVARFSLPLYGLVDTAWVSDTDGPVYSIATDGDQGVYFGGEFTQIAGVTRYGLARMTPVGALDGWNPSTLANVYTLAITASHVLASGIFHAMGGLPKASMARIGKATATADAAWPTVLNPGLVRAMARDVAGRLVIAGSFGIMGDLTTRRRGIARLNPDGSLDATWNPISTAGFISAVATDALGNVYAGAFFNLSKYAASGGARDTAWSPVIDGGVNALAVDASGRLYVGGGFSTVAGQSRSGLARLSTDTPVVDAAWNPQVSGSVSALLLDGIGGLYVGGSFSAIGGQPRSNLARISAGTTAVADASWAPSINQQVRSLALEGSALFAGGPFTSVGGQPRNCLAKLSTAGGAAMDSAWAPFQNAFCNVAALAAPGNGSLYVAGAFSNIGGGARAGLARISSTGTGAAHSNWNVPLLYEAAIDMSSEFALQLDAAGNLAVGGPFMEIAVQPRAGFAIVGTNSGAPQFTSAATATFNVLTPNAFTVTASGSPTPTLSRTAGSLPSGVSFDPVTGGLSGTPASGTVGSYPQAFTATNGAGTTNQSFTLVVARASQAITFNNPGTIPHTGKIPRQAGAIASSALPVTYATQTPSVCSVTSTGSITTIVGDQVCTITASQAGNGDFHSAADVTQSFMVASTPPGAVAISSIERSFNAVRIVFAPPENTGGIAITGYMATCNPGGLTAITSTSPVTITGLTPGVAYTCTVVATNANGAGPAAPPPAGTAGLTVSSTALAFGGQSMGTSSALVPLTVTNVGATSVGVTGISLSSQYTATNTCTTLAPGATCIVNVTFSPTVVAGPVNTSVDLNGTLTITHNAGSALTVALLGTGEKSLVAHYYRSILNRAPDAAGKAYWDAEAMRLAALGANINEVWFVMANYFFNSAEYVAAGKTNTAFMIDVYNTFFNRPPDQSGFDFWMSQMAAGLSREGVIFWFMFSNEFRSFTQGIFGNTAARPEVDMVMDLFRGILNRFPETAAFNAYVGTLRQAQCQPQAQRAGAVYTAVNDISYFFLFGSSEYANRARSNTQNVSDMYNAFLRRGGVATEVGFWINQLNTNAKDRNQLRADFIASAEFGARVNAVIAAGCVN